MSWFFGNLGYDTGRNLWFLECFDSKGQPNTFHTAKEIKVVNGWGNQFQFRDEGGQDIWHVRERIYAADVASITVKDDVLTLTFIEPAAEFKREPLPEKWDYILYAYRLKGNVPWGFIEFYDKDDKLLGKILGVWIAVERLDHWTVGTYPNIRFRANREKIREIVLTDFNAIIVGIKP